jgi:glutathione S-transferase
MPTIHGANISPFVRKVRVFLAEKNLPYQPFQVLIAEEEAVLKKLS